MSDKQSAEKFDNAGPKLDSVGADNARKEVYGVRGHHSESGAAEPGKKNADSADGGSRQAGDPPRGAHKIGPDAGSIEMTSPYKK